MQLLTWLCLCHSRSQLAEISSHIAAAVQEEYVARCVAAAALLASPSQHCVLASPACTLAAEAAALHA